MQPRAWFAAVHESGIGTTRKRLAARTDSDETLRFWIVLGEIHEHADAPHLAGLLCPSRERPRNRRAEVAGVAQANFARHYEGRRYPPAQLARRRRAVGRNPGRGRDAETASACIISAYSHP